MPRTKAPRKKVNNGLSEYARDLIPVIEETKRQIHLDLEQRSSEFLLQLKSQLLKSKLSIPKNIADKTIGELVEQPLNWSGNSTNASIIQVLNATKTLTTKKNKKTLRSSSFGDDEGYLTTESSKSTSGGRQSRARSRLQKTARVSRSLSTRQKSSVDKYKTPGQKIPPSTYGTVTPKVKPNTPQVLLRRPKLGEVILSLQGSPLLAGSVMNDNVANINIPLDDGRLLSIQPEKGLRISQIPQLDAETKRQLETLRDNLNKVCAISGKR
jgi:borealin